jgi:hypothetical protein
MRLSFLAIFFILITNIATAQNSDSHEAYYYPKTTSQEVFDRVLFPTPPTNKDVRIGFATTITKAQLATPESPRFVVFTKGESAEKLIITALDDEVFKTLYRARAVLALLTSNLRGNNFLAKQDLKNEGTFYDLLQFMHFNTLVITNGETWAHKVKFVSE